MTRTLSPPRTDTDTLTSVRLRDWIGIRVGVSGYLALHTWWWWDDPSLDSLCASSSPYSNTMLGVTMIVTLILMWTLLQSAWGKGVIVDMVAASPLVSLDCGEMACWWMWAHGCLPKEVHGPLFFVDVVTLLFPQLLTYCRLGRMVYLGYITLSRHQLHLSYSMSSVIGGEVDDWVDEVIPMDYVCTTTNSFGCSWPIVLSSVVAMYGMTRYLVQRRRQPMLWCLEQSREKNMRPGKVIVNDHSGMSRTVCHEVWTPRTVADLVTRVTTSCVRTTSFGLRGAAHSMGGQSALRHATLIDMRHLDRVCLLPDSRTTFCTKGEDAHHNHHDETEKSYQIEAEAGAQWDRVIETAWRVGRSPMVVQSFCNFSVGGSIAVNAHGIVSDAPLEDSIECLDLLTHDTRRLVHTCRVHLPHLFGAVMGGLGLAGIVVRAHIRTVPNLLLRPRSLLSSTTEKLCRDLIEVRRRYGAVISFARLDLSNVSGGQVFYYVPVSHDSRSKSRETYQNDSGVKGVASVGEKLVRVGVKWWWGRPWFDSLRFKVERYTRRPLDTHAPSLSVDTRPQTRNEIMLKRTHGIDHIDNRYKHATLDDTFVLHEFFVPEARASVFVTDLSRRTHRFLEHSLSRIHRIALLNVTLRRTSACTHSILAHTTEPSVAVVLYFRLARTPDADHRLGHLHNTLAELAVHRDGGRFYLPYRRCYSVSLFREAYPRWHEFRTRVATPFDQRRLVDHEWARQYIDTL